MCQMLHVATALAAIFLLTACGSVTPMPTATPLPSPTIVPSPTVTPSPMASLVPTLTSTPMPTRTPSPTAIPATPSATVAKGVYDGTWQGTTSQGKAIKFKIENDTVTLFAIEFEPKVCGVSVYTSLEAQALKGNTFDKVIKFGVTTWFVVSGTIDAQGKMLGTLVAEKTLLCEPTQLEWNAMR